MIKNSFNEEYKTPKCKVVGIHVQKVVCTSPTDYTLGGGGFYDDSSTNDNGEY